VARYRTPATIQYAIYREASFEKNSREITRTIRAQYGDDAPVYHTVYRYVTSLRKGDVTPPEEKEMYDIFSGGGEDARRVLDVLGVAMTLSEGRVESVSKADAQEIIYLRTAYPEMPLIEVWRLTSCLRYQIEPYPGVSFVEWLAYRLWESAAFAHVMWDHFGPLPEQGIEP
jgi:hypothetical protein